MHPTSSAGNDHDATCDTMVLACGLGNLAISHETKHADTHTLSAFGKALESLTHHMKRVSTQISMQLWDEEIRSFYTAEGREFLPKVALIPCDSSEWCPSPNNVMQSDTAAKGQHQEFLLVLAPDKKERVNLPDFGCSAKFRFNLCYQFEPIPETTLSRSEIKDMAYNLMTEVWFTMGGEAQRRLSALEEKHRRTFMLQNCGRQFRCTDDEAYQSGQALEGFEPLKLKAFIPLDLSAKELQGYESVDQARDAIALEAARSIYLESDEAAPHETRNRLEAWLQTHYRYTARTDNLKWQEVIWTGQRIQNPHGASPDIFFYHVTVGEHPRWPTQLQAPPTRVHRLPSAWLSGYAKAVERACSHLTPRCDPLATEHLAHDASTDGVKWNGIITQASIKHETTVGQRGVDVLLLDKSGILPITGYDRSTARQVGGGNGGGLHTHMILSLDPFNYLEFRFYVRDGAKTVTLAKIQTDFEGPSIELEYVNARLPEGKKKLQVLDKITHLSPWTSGMNSAGTPLPDLQSLMGDAKEPYLNSECVQHYHNRIVFGKVRLNTGSISVVRPDDIRHWDDHGLSSAVDAALEMFSAPGKSQIEIRFLMPADKRWAARFAVAYHRKF